MSSARLRSKFNVPAQNLVYADTQGNIGYQMPGNIPIRKNGDGIAARARLDGRV